eukprot:2270214-Alexandrium_andersonii.AAC.1
MPLSHLPVQTAVQSSVEDIVAHDDALVANFPGQGEEGPSCREHPPSILALVQGLWIAKGTHDPALIALGV